MRSHTRTCARAFAAALALCLLFGGPAAARSARSSSTPTPQATQRQQQQPLAPLDIHYTVSMPRPDTHLLHVELRLRWPQQSSPRTLDLVMPVWTPGSYLVREYERHVQDFAAREGGGDDGRALGWEKADKNTWRVSTGGAREARITYAVYANDLTVRTNELNDRRTFWNNAALLMHPAGHLASPSTLRVVPHGNWKIATGLPAVAGERGTFRAEDFDVLYDSPFLVSDHRVISFEVGGRPHRIVIDGEGNYDASRVERDVRRIVEASVALMGGEVPYRDYTFLLLLANRSGGGLEHSNSTAIIANRFGFRPDAAYQGLLETIAHEFFHVWNVKRIRPDALGPFDYTSENYTRSLWVAEGVTSYFEGLIMRRAGLVSDKDFLATAARSFEALQNTPGRLKMSVEEASFDAWVRHYRPDENTPNVAVSYYDKGGILGLLLDLEIRRRSAGARTLADAMRHLYEEFYKKGRNYTPADFQRAAELQAGSSLEEFFRRYVRGRDELDYDAALAAAGLRLERTAAPDPSRPRAPGAHLGASLTQEGDRLIVRFVPSGTPAYEQGLYANDQIVAVDGYRASLVFLNARLAEKRPGDTLALTVFRADELRTIQFKLGTQPEGPYKIVPSRAPTLEQTKIYESWLGAPFPKG
jgi:predicted metalloprotease with PDZ domain